MIDAKDMAEFIYTAVADSGFAVVRKTADSFRTMQGEELVNAFHVIGAAVSIRCAQLVENIIMANNSTALATNSNQPGELAQLGSMSVQTIIDRKRKIAEVMDAVMKDGEHYGKIPGCGDKPSLFKAGAEVLATTFGLAPTFEVMEVNYPNGHREYRITCTLSHIATGAVLGQGLGSCSTMESKYRWRRGERTCPNCKKATIIKGKDEYGGGWVCFAKKGGCGAKWADGAKEIEAQEVGRVENPDIADTFNTVLKIAKKRAQVDCTLTAVGASDLLTQDLEDLPPGSHDAPKPHTEPAPQPVSTEKATPPSSSKPPKDTKASNKKKEAPPTIDVMSEDDIIELIEQMSRCGTEVALQKLATANRARVLGQPDPIKGRILKAHAAQLAEIHNADASERKSA